MVTKCPDPGVTRFMPVYSCLSLLRVRIPNSRGHSSSAVASYVAAVSPYMSAFRISFSSSCPPLLNHDLAAIVDIDALC